MPDIPNDDAPSPWGDPPAPGPSSPWAPPGGPPAPGPAVSSPRRPLLSSRATRVVASSALAAGLALGGYGVAAAASGGSSTTPPPSGQAVPPSTGLHGSRMLGPRGRGQLGLGGGTVTAINGASVTIRGPGGQSRTVTTTSSTTYDKDGKLVPASALGVGDHVRVRLVAPAAGASNSAVAAVIDIILPRVQGTVVSVQGTTVTVADGQGFWHTVDLSSSTTVTRGGQPSSDQAVAKGDHIVAAGTIESNHTSLAASTVTIELPQRAGRVTAVSGSVITITARGGATLKVDTNSSTVFTTSSAQGHPTAGSLSDVKTGDMIVAQGTRNADGSLSATSVSVLPTRPAARGNGGRGGPMGQMPAGPAAAGG